MFCEREVDEICHQDDMNPEDSDYSPNDYRSSESDILY